MSQKPFTRIDGTHEAGEVNDNYLQRVANAKKLIGANPLSIDISAMISALSDGDPESLIDNFISVALEYDNAKLARKLQTISRR